MAGGLVLGDVAFDGRVVLYIIKADQTNYINYIKPLILAEELGLDYVLSVIDTKATWYYTVHPERYVPALKDWCGSTNKEVIVFEGTACLQYLAGQYDVDGVWAGRNAAEKAAVLSWTAYQTAGLGATAKYWLYFLKGYPNRQNPEVLPKTVAKLHENCVRQWQILEQRLALDGQQYIALPDRPTLADLSYFPFAMPWMFKFLGVDLQDFPNIEAWVLGIAIVFLSFVATCRTDYLKYVTKYAGWFLSTVINRYLLLANPIRSCDGQRRNEIPTCAYQWPNGQGDIAKFLEGERNSNEWFQEFGRVYRIWNGLNSEVVLTDPEDIKTVFKDSDTHLKAPNNDAGWLMGQLLGKCLGLVSGAEWNHILLSTRGGFSRKSVATHLPRMERLVCLFFENLDSQFVLNHGTPSLGKDLQLLPFWIVADYLYGDLTPEMRAELKELIPLRTSLFNRVIQGGLPRYPWSQYLPTSTNADLKTFKGKWIAFNDAAFLASKLARNNTPIVHMYECLQSGSINLENLLQTLDEMLFANLDVTFGALSWNPLYLAVHPTVQEDLRREMNAAWEGEAERQGHLDAYLMSSHTLLAASILESARLKPAAAFSVPQAAPTDRVVGCYLVPAGTSFVVDTHALNIRNSYWGSDSADYRPSRFLGRNAAEMRYHYWRFGFGPRQCLGKHIAELILRLIIVHLVRHYRLSLVSSTNYEKTPDMWITQASTEIQCEKITSSDKSSLEARSLIGTTDLDSLRT